MSYIHCRYNNSIVCTNEKLSNIPELPWRHKVCQINDISNCGKSWKTRSPVYALVPTMSRPVPQVRRWCAPGRPLPQISDISDYSINGGKIDPTTGNYIDDIQYNGQTINNNDYLHYNNPNVKINNKGQIACLDEEGTYQQNFYSGPGWKSSRVHGRTKTTALPRPIKHWRRQLFPRQYIDQEGQPIPDLPADQIDLGLNKLNRGRHYSGLGLIELPNGYTITTIKILQDSISMLDKNNQNILIGARSLSCKPVWIIDTNLNEKDDIANCSIVNKKTPLSMPQCPQRSALIRARPNSYNDRGPFQFQSNKGYLQSRSRLHYQVSTISYIPNLYNNNLKNSSITNERLEEILYDPKVFPPSTFSLYRNNKPVVDTYSISNVQTCYNPDISINIYSNPTEKCLCKQTVIYKPSNRKFQRNSAVKSSTNIKQKSRNTIKQNQYNVTNQWGIISPKTTFYTTCNTSRVTLRGTTKCYNTDTLRYPYGK